MKIAVIEGDGVGCEVVNESLNVLHVLSDRYDIPCEIKKFPFSADYYLKTGITIDKEFIEKIDTEYSALLFGAVGDPRIKSNIHARDILMGLRFKKDLYINFRPVRLYDKRYCPLKNKSEKDIDFVIFRENVEDCYINSGSNFMINTPQEVAIENNLHTRRGVERIIRYAFEYAKKNKLTSVTMGDKSNVMRYVGGLWQRTFYDVGEEYPEIEKKHMYIDALHMQVIKDPGQFEVIVTSNLFGDILTDVCAQIQGGMGLAPSVNFNPEKSIFKGLYEPVHGSAPDIAGKKISNPVACILCVSLLLEDHGYKDQSQLLNMAVKNALENDIITPDLGGRHSTSDVGDYICNYICKN